ncbi:CDC50 family protein [Colletotrichum truncatum]|uniref:CDC50 family protein n=1 Tax=Colletotrichum truncatum TaxID=5467 RepID=A0ACC3YQ65_COLTU|nr:CDC50 family protein [Colletotrichum truncatum]KAF6796737.1 CDC50 family protein [Colletotrichum truncatum]
MHWTRLKRSSQSLTEEKSRMPKVTSLNQQRMKSWEPILTPTNSIKVFLCMATVFLAIGIVWLVESDKIREIRLNYTACHEIESYNELEVMPPENIDKSFKASSAGQVVERWKRSNQSITYDGVMKNYTMCTIEFFLPEDLQPPVLYYYRLTNFHQNHRQYIFSRHTNQLKGEAVGRNTLEGSDCAPLASHQLPSGEGKKIIYPCGLIANSYFNDTFSKPLRLSSTSGSNETKSYNMSNVGIAEKVDKTLFRPTKYQIPSSAGNDSIIVPPPGWTERYPNGYHAQNMFNPAEDESFMVWMRTSSGPSFSKMALRNDKDVMERGLYRLEVISHFPIHKNRGTKSIIISTTSAVGGRNNVIGRVYIAMGCLSLFLTFVSALTLRYRPRRLTEHDYLHRSISLLSKADGRSEPLSRAGSY